MQHNTRDRITDHKYLTEMQRIKNQYPNRKSRKRSWHKRALVTWQQATQLSLTNRATHMCKCNSRKKGEIYEQICLLSQSALAIRNWYYYLIKIALVKSVFSHVSVIFVCYHLYGVVNKIFNGASDLKTRPFPYVLPCRIWSFCVKGCGYKYKRNPQVSHSSHPQRAEFQGSPIWAPNWGALELRSLRMGRMADPKIRAPPHMCYHVKFGSYATKGVRINRKEPQNWRALGLHPLGVGWSWPHRNNPSPRVILANLVVLGQTVERY